MTLQNPLQDNLNSTIITGQLAEQWAAFAVITLGVAMVLFTLFSPYRRCTMQRMTPAMPSSLLAIERLRPCSRTSCWWGCLRECCQAAC